MSKSEHSPLPCCWSDVNGQDCKCARRQSDQQAIAELVEAIEQNNAFVERLVGFVTGTHDIPDAKLADHINGILAINDDLLTKHKAKP